MSDMVDIYHNFKLVVRNLIALHMLYRNPEAMPLSLVLTRKQYTVIQVLTGTFLLSSKIDTLLFARYRRGQ